MRKNTNILPLQMVILAQSSPRVHISRICLDTESEKLNESRCRVFICAPLKRHTGATAASPAGAISGAHIAVSIPLELYNKHQ